VSHAGRTLGGLLGGREGTTVADRDVYFVKITRNQAGMFDRSFAQDLMAAIDPHGKEPHDKEVERYRKLWRLSRPKSEDGFIVGKLGFERTAAAAQTRYDEQLEDFVTDEAVANQGSFAMFVVDEAREIMAFEERVPDIKFQAFIGAFRLLLHKNDPRWSAVLLPDPTQYDEFVRSVDSINRIRAVVRRPNPGFLADAKNFEDVIVASHAERAEIVAVAASGEGLVPDAPWVKGALAQITEQGVGTLTAVGTKEGRRRKWKFGTRLQVAVMSDEVDTQEGIWDWMERQVRERFGE
jgi:hypothetical protein